MSTRPFLVLSANINLPVMNTAGTRPIGITSFFIPITIFFDKLFPDKKDSHEDSNPPYHLGYNQSSYYSSDPYLPSSHGYPTDHYPYRDYPSDYPSNHYSSPPSDYSHPPTRYPPVEDHYSPPSHGHSSSSSSYSSYEARKRREAGRVWMEGSNMMGWQGHTGLSKPTVVLGNGRSLGEDQATLYQQVEASLAVVGVDGRGCLLKAVCEAQSSQLLKLNLLGHLLTAFLSPVEADEEGGREVEVYKRASQLGQDGANCALHFPGCPVSVLDIFKFGKKGNSKKGSSISKTKQKFS